MSGEILFLAHRVPFPPNRGDKIRSHHVLRHLASLAPVHVATFADDATDMVQDRELGTVAASYCLIQRHKSLVRAGLEAINYGRPISLTAFHDLALAAYVRKVLAERPVGTIYAFSGQMGQYIPASFKGRVIFDFVDVDSAKFEAYAEAGRGPRRWLEAREGRLMRSEEARLARRVDISLLISNEEAALFRARLLPRDRLECDVRVLRNGIDSALFDRAICDPAPAMLECSGPRLIFTGQMDYAPNVAAAQRVIERLLPSIRQQFPQATFHVVGRSPPGALQAQHGRGGVYVWGAVDDMRCFLAAADLALVPLELARGVQNKVLEAMAMRLPVVLTPAAATGIGGSEHHHFAIGHDDNELVTLVCTLLSDAEHRLRLGSAARHFVVDTLSWSATLAPLAAMLDLPDTAARDAA